MKNSLSQFTNKYSLSKTLRFELVPQGKTLESIKAKGLLKQDQARADSYQEMKKTIDEYHKWFIDLALKKVRLENLQEFASQYYLSKDQKDDSIFNKIKTDLRKEITKKFNEGDAKKIFKNLFAKELIKDDLDQWIKVTKQELFYDEGFKNFTTYFLGFHENRKNMYSSEEIGTGIAYRLIHENLPKFLDNIKIYHEAINKNTELDFTNTLIGLEELMGGETLEEIFSIDNFNNLLTQKGISYFNSIVGGYSLKEGGKMQGLNECINLYNQQQKDKNKRVSKFKLLYKQILSDRINNSYLAENFKDDGQLYEAIENYYTANLIGYETNGDIINVLERLKNLLSQIPEYDLSKIYLKNDSSLTTISQNIFKNFSVFKTAISYYYDKKIDPKYENKYNKIGISEASAGKLAKEKAKWNGKYISIQMVQTCLDEYSNSLDNKNTLKNEISTNRISDYFKNHYKFSKTNKEGIEKIFDFNSNINEQFKGIEGLLKIEKQEKDSLKQDKERVHQIKLFLDAIKDLQWFCKPLQCNDDSNSEKDEKFYTEFAELFDQLDLITPLYNRVRNYVTQKPYETTKIKLNFENAQLLNGWDQNKEKDNSAIILRKNNLYYLAIMDKKSNKIFENIPIFKENEACYEKMTYKLLPGANKQLPRVIFSDTNIKYFNPSEEVLRIRNTATHSKGGEPQEGFAKGDFNLNDCHTLIDFFKESLAKHMDWKHFGFKFSSTKSYDDISGFYREVENQGYKISFENINETYINEKVESGELYLFQIYNKDFSEFSKGTPNMHTLYWKMLFDENNLKDVVYKLNGQGEVFFREASIQLKNIVIHPQNKPIDSKNPLKPGKNTFVYDILKDKRFTIDKFQFHIPITMNFKAEGNGRINDDVNKYLQNNPDINIIGLDRGERHLVYLTLINQKGEILKQESLNTIEDEKHEIITPYHTLLDTKEKQRAEAREEWGAIESIKELKDGYISQVVHKISEMMVNHNAIVVMEDLNFGFKRGRFKVEKQVYQKLEKMLIDKLNYLVFKNPKENEPDIMNALQLTSKFISFKEMGKQMGFLFYVPAWNTSKIDPTTGFVNFIYTKYESEAKAKELFGKFESIKYNAEANYFEFEIKNYNNFNNRADGTRQKWTICTNDIRIETFRNTANNSEWDNREIVLTKEFVELFEKFDINYKQENLKNLIIAQSQKAFFEKLIYLLKLTLQIRNSITKSDVDFMISPVMNASGEFFDSRKQKQGLPKNADANGAYHIAKKGLWVLENINKAEDLTKLKLAISNKEWLQFVQYNE